MCRIVKVGKLMNVATLVTLSLVSSGAKVLGNEDGDKDVIEHTRSLLERLPPARVYGKVLDQNDVPVEGAAVDVHWKEANPLRPTRPFTKKTLVYTLADGTWKLSALRGGSVFVQSVSKVSYEFSHAYNPFLRSPERVYLDRWTTKENPVVIRLRKKGETTLLLRPRGHVLSFSGETMTYRINLVESVAKIITDDSTPDYDSADIVITGARIESPAGWVFTVEAIGTDGGVLLEGAQSVRYEAPEEGYRAEEVVDVIPRPHPHIPTKLKVESKYRLNLRSRDSLMYSSVMLMFRAENDAQECRLEMYDIMINPYGSRNMEYEVALDKRWELEERLTNEAKAALMRGERPAVPDLPALIRAGGE